MLNQILLKFGLTDVPYKIQAFGSGLINYTLKVSGRDEDYILQRINGNVFKFPRNIARNLALLQSYLKNTHPDYPFVAPLPSISGDFMVRSDEGEYYRLFTFIKGSRTIDVITESKQAYEASRQFGRFTHVLKDFDANTLEYTLTDFHNLKLRFDQFKYACGHAGRTRLDIASAEIEEIYKHQNILETYADLIANNSMPVRVIHHDTKISNVLFDDEQNGLCVIDLDTVMPGYYLSDLGDMMRTYLSPANEEETDLSKIHIRENIFSAICKGYLSEMGNVLNETEKKHFIFSGKFMIYMQALRFLTDFLNGDIYYEIKYPEHNFTRSKNQLKLLNEYIGAEEKLNQLFVMAQDDLVTTTDD